VRELKTARSAAHDSEWATPQRFFC